MNLKKLIYVCQLIGVYGTYCYDCLNNLPSLNDEGKRKPFGTNKDSFKEESVQRVHEVHN